MQKKYSWVVLKHEIEYFSPAYLGDSILIRSWVEKSEGVRSERHVEFYNQSDKLMVRARTSWCLLDSGTFRPVRIGEDILKVFH
jgi:acyl-CoA thioester hydrolase